MVSMNISMVASKNRQNKKLNTFTLFIASATGKNVLPHDNATNTKSSSAMTFFLT